MKMQKETKPECIGVFFIRSFNTHGKAKIYVYVYSDGSNVQHKLYLSDIAEIPGCRALCTKFGKTLHLQSIAYKYTTMAAIHDMVNEILADNNVKPEDILL